MARREEPLVGDDGQLMTGVLGTKAYEGNGENTLADLMGEDGDGTGMFVVQKMAAKNSFFPKGMKAGDLYPALGQEVLAQGDSVVRLELTHVADCTGWQLQITQSEIDVTRLSDEFKKYRLGKKDASGTVNSIMTLGVSDEPDGIVARTMRLYRRSSEGDTTKVTITELENRPMYFLGYLRRTDTPGETQAFVFCQAYLFNITLGGSTGNAQSYDSSLRLTGMDPVFYSLDNPAA